MCFRPWPCGVFHTPVHPYTQALSLAFPEIGDDRFRRKPEGLGGDPPDPQAIPSGCPFHPRCPKRFEPCDDIVPELWDAGEHRTAACLLVAIVAGVYIASDADAMNTMMPAKNGPVHGAAVRPPTRPNANAPP